MAPVHIAEQPRSIGGSQHALLAPNSDFSRQPVAVPAQAPLAAHMSAMTQSNEQHVPMPPPQVQKRGPPRTSHPAESPAKKQSKWSADENATITRLRGEGMKWEDISQHLPGRSAISCRLHYQNFLERKAEWDEEKKNKLARLYDRFKKDMWDPVAKELGMPWRAVEAMHWELGNEGIAARTGVPVFATASATATEPPSIPSALASAPGPTLSQVLKYSNISPQKPPAELPNAYGRGTPSSGPQQPAAMLQGQHTHHNTYPPPPQIPQETRRPRQRRSASSTPSSSRARSSSSRRTASGARVNSTSPALTNVSAPADRPPTSIAPQLSNYPPLAPNYPPNQVAESGRLPPMRFLTEPTPEEQRLDPMPYRRPPEAASNNTPPSGSERDSSLSRIDSGGGASTYAGGGNGGERR